MNTLQIQSNQMYHVVWYNSGNKMQTFWMNKPRRVCKAWIADNKHKYPGLLTLEKC